MKAPGEIRGVIVDEWTLLEDRVGIRRRSLLAGAIAAAFAPLGLARASGETAVGTRGVSRIVEAALAAEQTLVEIPISPPLEPVSWAVDIGPGPDRCSFWGYVVDADGARRIVFERTCKITRQGTNDVLEVPLRSSQEGVSLDLMTRGESFSIGYRVDGGS